MPPSLPGLVLALTGYTGFWSFVLPFVAYALGIGIAMAPMLTRALSADRSATGSVAALLGTLTMVCAYIGSQTATVIYDGTTLPVAWAIAGISVGAGVIYVVTDFHRLFGRG